MSREELEDQLQATWSRDHLAVYADVLSAEGDPRGELVACDLHLAMYGRGIATHDQLRRRTEILVQLIGAEAYARFRTTASFEYGFVTRLPLGGTDGAAAERAVLDGPLGAYVRSVRISPLDASRLREALVLLASARRPWLELLQIHPPRETVPLDRETTAALIAATPRLAKLVIVSEDPPRPVFAAFDHPNRPAINRYDRFED